VEAHVKNKRFFQELLSRYKEGEKESVLQRIDYLLTNVALPSSIPKAWHTDFDPEQGIAIVEIRLPDVVHTQILKSVRLKSGLVQKPLNQREMRALVPAIHPAIMLRIAYEIFRNDIADVVQLLVLNGWVEFDDPATGNATKTYTASLAVTKEQVKDFNLSKLDPIAAFSNLKGKSAGKLIDIIPVTPVMSLDRKDKRFIETTEVLNTLDAQTNLAAMDWQDFESPYYPKTRPTVTR
jgi:restriction system protein